MNDQPMPRREEQRQSQPAPKQRRFGAAALLAALAVPVVLIASIVFVGSELALPRQTDLTAISQLMAANAVQRLDLTGSTLTVTEKNSSVLRVESVTADEFQQLAAVAIESGVAVHASTGSHASWSSQVIFFATLVLPVVVIAAVLLVVVRIVRRPPRMGYSR